MYMNASTSCFVWTQSCDAAAFIIKNLAHPEIWHHPKPAHTQHRTQAPVRPHHVTDLRSAMLVCAPQWDARVCTSSSAQHRR